jgi:hypothetical protein
MVTKTVAVAGIVCAALLLFFASNDVVSGGRRAPPQIVVAAPCVEQQLPVTMAAAPASPVTEQPITATSPRGRDAESAYVGFCITGGARSFALTAQNIATNVVDAIQPDRSRRSVIFNFQTTNDCEANPVNTADQKQSCAVHFAESAALIGNGTVQSMFGASVIIENDLTCHHPFAKNHSECCRRRRNALADHNQGGLWSYSQVLRRRMCIQHLYAEEAKLGRKFDYIVLMRPDMLFWEPVPPAGYLMRLNKILATSKEKDQPPADYLYMMPRHYLEPFDGCLYDVFDNYCATNRWNAFIMSPEFRFVEWINRRLMPFQVYPFQTTILRSKTAADCDRLDSEVLRMATVRKGDELMRVHELCWRMFPKTPK